MPSTAVPLVAEVSFKGCCVCCASGLATIWLLGGMSFLRNQPPLEEEEGYAGLVLLLKENLPDPDEPPPTPLLPKDHSLTAKTRKGIENSSKKTVVHAVAIGFVPKVAEKPASLKWERPFAYAQVERAMPMMTNNNASPYKIQKTMVTARNLDFVKRAVKKGNQENTRKAKPTRLKP